MPLAYEVESEIKRMERAIRLYDKALSDDGQPVRRGLTRMSGAGSRFASSITHIDTATLYRSYGVRQGVGTSGAYATIYILPGIVNPRGQRPVVYGPYEFGRGGDHDAFGRTVQQSDQFVEPAIEQILNDAGREASRGF